MRTIPRLVLIGLLVLVASCGWGCESALSGKVVSSSTGEPVVGATIEVSGITAVSGYDGRFTVEGLKGEGLQGTVSLEGFESMEFAADLLDDETALVLEIPDCILTVSAVEKAIEPSPLGTVTVVLDGVTAVTTPPTFRRLPPGEHTLVVTSENHEPYESTLTLDAGESSVTVELSLTPAETYRRYLEASLHNLYEVKYAYVHPDEQKVLTLERSIELDAGTQMKSYAVGAVRMLDSWTSGFTGKTYTNVAAIDRRIEYQVTDPKRGDYGQVYTGNFTQHWVELDGIWRLVHAERL